MKKLIAVMCVAGVLGGCAAPGQQGTDQQQPSRATMGAIIGALGGAVLGNQTHRKNGALAGAVIGAVAGGSIGYYMDKQEQDYKNALATEQRNHELEIQRVRDNLMKLTLNSEASFDFGQATVKPAFYPTLDKLANLMQKYSRTHVTIVGYTDSVGSAAYNQRLSERRARAVADYLVNQGVDASRIRTEGRGESNPRASNATASGRQLNRRVELLIRPDSTFQQ